MSLWQLASSVAQPPWASGFIRQATQVDDSGQAMGLHEDMQLDCAQPTRACATVADVPGHGESLQLFVPARSDAMNAAHLTQVPESLPELPPLELPLPELPLPEPELPPELPLLEPEPLELLPPSPPLPELLLLHANAAARLTPMPTLTSSFFIASPLQPRPYLDEPSQVTTHVAGSLHAPCPIAPTAAARNQTRPAASPWAT
jgi:hypothetical protein